MSDNWIFSVFLKEASEKYGVAKKSIKPALQDTASLWVGM